MFRELHNVHFMSSPMKVLKNGEFNFRTNSKDFFLLFVYFFFCYFKINFLFLIKKRSHFRLNSPFMSYFGIKKDAENVELEREFESRER